MINYQQKDNYFYISYFGESGKVEMLKIEIPDKELFTWQECHPGDPKRVQGRRSQHGNPVKKVYRARLDRYRSLEFIMNLPKNIKEKVHSMNQPQKWYMDIETEVVSDRPDAANPMGKVLTNAFCNSSGNIFVQGSKPLTDLQKERINNRINDHLKTQGKRWQLKYKFYDSEFAMLQHLFGTIIPGDGGPVWGEGMPLITGWNFLKFDWQYLWRRAERLGIDVVASSRTRTSHNLSIKDKYDRTNTKRDHIPLPHHRAILDYMAIWEKFDTYVKHKSSSGLDYVAGEVLGVQKVHHGKSLTELYDQDYESYVFYNAVDAALVCLIDEKLGTLNTSLKLASVGQTQIHDSSFASVSVETLFYDELYKDGVVFVANHDKPEESTYSGGYVLDPKTGLYQEVAIADFVSHYPSTTAAFNIGNDSFVGMYEPSIGKIRTRQDTLLDVDPVDHIITAPSQTKEETDEMVAHKPRAVFSKSRPSNMRRVISRLFNRRVEAKYAGATIDSEIAVLQSLLKVPK